MSVHVFEYSTTTDRQEDQDVALGLGRMQLEDGCDGSVEVVCLGLLGVVSVDREATTGHFQKLVHSISGRKILTIEDGGIVKVRGKLLCVQRCTGDEQAEFGTEASDILWNMS